jgi:hypothetical protein
MTHRYSRLNAKQRTMAIRNRLMLLKYLFLWYGINKIKYLFIWEIGEVIFLNSLIPRMNMLQMGHCEDDGSHHLSKQNYFSTVWDMSYNYSISNLSKCALFSIKIVFCSYFITIFWISQLLWLFILDSLLYWLLDCVESIQTTLEISRFWFVRPHYFRPTNFKKW